MDYQRAFVKKAGRMLIIMLVAVGATAANHGNAIYTSRLSVGQQPARCMSGRLYVRTKLVVLAYLAC